MPAKTPAIKIEIVHRVTQEIVDAFERLLPQLSPSATKLTQDQLAQIVAIPMNTIFIARDLSSLKVVGTLTLVQMTIPTGERAWIEDVVVDSDARGLGAGEALVSAAITRAKILGARTIDLTSGPTRVAAHRLYEKKDFVARDTNVYRYSLK